MMAEQAIRDMKTRYWTLLDQTKNKIERERLSSIIVALTAVLEDD